jgi:hypothetical protein
MDGLPTRTVDYPNRCGAVVNTFEIMTGTASFKMTR